MSTYIIAEAGVNHNGSLESALRLVDAAASAGADAVKFQTFKTENEISRFAPKAEYQSQTTPSSESQFEMVKKLELGRYEHSLIIKRCKKMGIQFLSTPFDLDSLNLLVKTFNVSRLKIPSGEITNPLLLLKAAQSGRPVILSTGMSNLGEIERALGVLAFGYLRTVANPSIEAFSRAYSSDRGQKLLRQKVTLLHCTTEYPAPYSEVNLLAMDTLRHSFGLPVGYSDHTRGISVSIAAAARGAAIIEKHFTLDRNMPGPDHKASLIPEELRSLVRAVREVDAALGNPFKAPSVSELKNILVVRKSLVAACRIKKGEIFTEKNVAVKRPGAGLSPFRYWELLGEKAEKHYAADEAILI